MTLAQMQAAVEAALASGVKPTDNIVVWAEDSEGDGEARGIELKVWEANTPDDSLHFDLT